MNNAAPLCADLVAKRKQLRQLNREIVSLEQGLIEALGIRDEGSKTHDLDDYKVTITQPVTRSVDMEVLTQLSAEAPHYEYPINQKIAYQVDKKMLDDLIENHPEVWRAINKAFTTKPGKPQVKVQEI